MNRGKIYKVYEGNKLIHTGNVTDMSTFFNVHKSTFTNCYRAGKLLKNKYLILSEDVPKGNIKRNLSKVPVDDMTPNEYVYLLRVHLLMFGNTICVRNDKPYIEKLKKMGLNVTSRYVPVMTAKTVDTDFGMDIKLGNFYVFTLKSINKKKFKEDEKQYEFV